MRMFSGGMGRMKPLGRGFLAFRLPCFLIVHFPRRAEKERLRIMSNFRVADLRVNKEIISHASMKSGVLLLLVGNWHVLR